MEEIKNTVAETAKKENNITTNKTAHYQPLSEYFKKIRHKMNPKLIAEIEETAKSEFLVEDDYGSYKPGTFTHKAFIVTVKRDNDLWSVHIWGKNPVTDYIVEEVRNRFIPDDVVMARLYESRQRRSEMKGIMMYEVPVAKGEE